MAEQWGVDRERFETGQKRLLNVLRSHGVATMRTLEQKISDAGPTNQRIDPHILTLARKSLVREGRVSTLEARSTVWFYVPSTPEEVITQRLSELLPVYSEVSDGQFTMRLGQTLEIAIYKALLSGPLQFFGAFLDLDAHRDDRLYRKEEPPSVISGRALPDRGRFDFLVNHPAAGAAGIEAKNIREWIYPDRTEVKDLLRKAIHSGAVPVLIARRIHYSTFSVLRHCGVIVHQTYNQLFPNSAADLAAKAARKDLLGYHDVRVGNDPDKRLIKFLHADLPTLLRGARPAFAAYEDLIAPFALGTMPYPEFAARVKRRSRREPEDLQPFEDEAI